MTLREFSLPDPGEGLVEADIVTWRVAVGDQVKINDIVVEIETSKSLVELPSPYAGSVSALMVAEGDTVDVGTPIIAIEDGMAVASPSSDESDGSSPSPEGVVKPTGTGSGERVAMLVGYGPKASDTRRRPRKSAAADPDSNQVHDQLAAASFTTDAPVSRRVDQRAALSSRTAQGEPSSAPPRHPSADSPVPPLPAPGRFSAPPTVANSAILAKPPVRKLAKDLGVDLAGVAGSGPGGVITRDDVNGVVSQAAQQPKGERPVDEVSMIGETASTSTPAPTDDLRIPIKGVRKATAAAMVQSAFTAPHVTEWVTCDVTATVELVARLKERREFREVRLSPLLIVAKAVCLALKRTPALNAFWDESSAEIVIKRSINLGIAAATPRGLVVPNIKGAGDLSLLDLAGAINDVVAVARDGKTQPAQMAGGTFTITNVGTFGVDAGTPILNPGESGILCIGQIARRPWVVGSRDDERIEPRWVSTLAVSFDHRLADGEQGSIFLANVAGMLGDPGLALLF